MKILIINGPNLNLLGTREPSIYGSRTMADCLTSLRESHPGVEIEYTQSNHEGDIIDALHRCGAEGAGYAGIVLNAGAYTHTSLAIADAIRSIAVPVIEVHISNIFAREAERHTSLLAPACRGTIVGFGLRGYAMAIDAIIDADPS